MPLASTVNSGGKIRYWFSSSAESANLTRGNSGGPTIKDHGFTVLAEGDPPEADIFFIHGLQGHPHDTWTYPSPSQSRHNPAGGQRSIYTIRNRFSLALGRSPGTKLVPVEAPAGPEVFWPFDILRNDFPNTRIITYGYDSHVTNWFKGPTMQLDIYSYGESLLNGLEACRRDAPDRPLIFIVHSLGGLILKDVLRRARAAMDRRFKAIYNSTNAIFFFGTPHRGGSYVNLGLTARKIAVCSGFSANDKLLRDLKFDSGTAKLLREEFAKMLDERRPLIYTFQEANGLSGFGPLSGKVVEDSSSALDHELEQKDYIRSNHVDMCRIPSPDDDGYGKIKAGLARCLKDDFGNLQSPTIGLRQRVLDSLYEHEARERFDQIEDAYDETCEWLFEKEELGFVKWLRGGKGIFWISGKPGSGKSTLMKFAVSDPRTFQNLYVNQPQNRWIWAEFFFTDRGKRSQKTLEGLLRQILYQLLSQARDLLEFVQQIFEDHANIQGQWLLIYLERSLMNIITQRKVAINICLFIDALDEHSEDYANNHWRLVEILQNLVKNSDGKIVKVMLCLSSRPENLFTDLFKTCPGFRIHEHTQQDVHTYVRGRVNSYLASRKDLTSNASSVAFLDDTVNDVMRRAQGVFLWVRLVTTDIIEGLIDGDSPDTVRRNLLSIPGDGDLEELYHRILLRLKESCLHEAFIMLHIAYSATEPLPLGEFFQAVDYTHKQDYDWTVPPEPEMERRLISRCRGFLEIQTASFRDQEGTDHTGKIVQFLHQSVKDFLAKERTFDIIHLKLKIKSPCNGHLFLLKFLISQHFRQYENRVSLLRHREQFDLRKFDVFYHARMVELTIGPVCMGPLDALADFVDRNALASVYLRLNGWVCPTSWEPSFLSLAVQAGLALFTEHAMTKAAGLNASRGRPLLHCAVMPLPATLCTRTTDPFIRSQEMVQLLISLGVEMNMEFERLTAIGLAFKEYTRALTISQENIKMLETLLGGGSDPNAAVDYSQGTTVVMDDSGNSVPQTKEIQTVLLQVAIRKKDRGLTKLLLDFGAKIEKLTVEDWDFFEKYNRPMSLLQKFREGDLNVRELDFFVNRGRPIALLKQYSQGELVLRGKSAGKKEKRYKEDEEDEVIVADFDFLENHEKSLQELLELYRDGNDPVVGKPPPPLRDWAFKTRCDVLYTWASATYAQRW